MKKQISLYTILCLLFLTPTYIFAQDYFQTQKIVASDRDSLDVFGRAVAISGNYAIVGADQEDDNLVGADSLAQAGSAYIYERDANGNWSQVQKIISSDRASADAFGFAVAISGDYAIVGAYMEDHDASGANNKSRAGSAYIFERDGGGTWSQVQKIVASDRNNNDRFGYNVSISGDYAIVGAYLEDHDASGLNSLSAAGSAYIFERDGGGTWSQTQKIVASDRGDSDRFGTSVGISGDYAIVGAFQEDHNLVGADSLSLAGAVYIFERDSGSGVWSEVQKSVASDRKAEARYGTTVSISGDYAAVGAIFEYHNLVAADSISRAGAVYILERDGGGTWSEAQKIVPSDRAKNDRFGSSVSVSGDFTLIGAYQEDHNEVGTNSISNSGSAYLYERNGSGIWNVAQKIKASNRANSDYFGYSASISGDNMVIGAYQEDDDVANSDGKTSSGSAYIFERPDISYSADGWEGGSGASEEPNTSDGAKDIAIIYGDVTLNTAANGNKLMITDGASLSIGSEGSLTLSDSTKIYGAEGLIINSTASATGNFIDNGIRYINTGSAKVERYLDAGSGNNLEPYHYFGSAINNHAKFNDVQNLFAYRESDLTWLYHNDVTDGFTNFANGVGYAVRYTTNITKSFTGSLNTGDYNVSVTSTNTGSAFQYFNLIANPYPSSISADDLVDDNSGVLGTNVYFWNGIDYAIYNTGLSSGTAGALGKTPDGNISVGQGFFVTASTAGTITFTNSMRGTDSNLFYKKESYPQLTLLVNADQERSSVLFTGHNMSSNSNDVYDAKHLAGNSGLSISSILNETAYDIQSVPDLNGHTFDLTILANEEKEVVFQLQNIVQLNGLHVYLEDKTLHTITDITNASYAARVFEGEDNKRFKLHIQEEIEESFTAWINNGYVNAFLDHKEFVGQVTLLALDGKTISVSKSNYLNAWNSLPSGVYILHFDNNKVHHTQKVVKF